jgi:hypothetical protein
MKPSQNNTETGVGTDPRMGGSFDGEAAADHDQPYRFGWRPRSSATYPFSTKQYARLLVLRSRVQAGLVTDDGYVAL